MGNNNDPLDYSSIWPQKSGGSLFWDVMFDVTKGLLSSWKKKIWNFTPAYFVENLCRPPIGRKYYSDACTIGFAIQYTAYYKAKHKADIITGYWFWAVWLNGHTFPRSLLYPDSDARKTLLHIPISHPAWRLSKTGIEWNPWVRSKTHGRRLKIHVVAN